MLFRSPLGVTLREIRFISLGVWDERYLLWKGLVTDLSSGSKCRLGFSLKLKETFL